MKVCILTTSFPRSKKDSAGIFLYHLSRWLVKKGVSVEVIAPHDFRCHFTENWENIQIHRFPYFFPFRLQRLCYGAGIVKNIKNNLLAILQLPSLCVSEFFYSLVMIRKIKPDIIHAHWSLPQGLIGIVLKKVFNVPCVTSIHGTDMHGLRSRIFKALNRMVIGNSDACTANSRATARLARQVGANANIEVVPMGVDTDYFSKAQNIVSLKRRFEVEGPVILFVGRLIDLKGIVYLINAMPAIVQRFPATKAFIIGSGPMKDALVGLTENLALQKNVVFINQMAQEDLVPFYSMADVFVLPSIVNESGETEGLGVVLLEAMACGLPVIGSNVGGIPDIISHGETGLLARQKDAQDLSNQIFKLFTDEGLRKKVIRNARNLIETQFSWAVVAEHFIHIYRHALASMQPDEKRH